MLPIQERQPRSFWWFYEKSKPFSTSYWRYIWATKVSHCFNYKWNYSSYISLNFGCNTSFDWLNRFIYIYNMYTITCLRYNTTRVQNVLIRLTLRLNFVQIKCDKSKTRYDSFLYTNSAILKMKKMFKFYQLLLFFCRWKKSLL